MIEGKADGMGMRITRESGNAFAVIGSLPSTGIRHPSIPRKIPVDNSLLKLNFYSVPFPFLNTLV